MPFESNANIERLRNDIWTAAVAMNVELTEDELARVVRGTTVAEGDPTAAHLDMRAAGLSLTAKDASVRLLPEDPTVRIEPEPKTDTMSEEEKRREKERLEEIRRKSGAGNLVLKAACYLKAMPELAGECLQYAWDVWYKKREWNADDVPQPVSPFAKPLEAELVEEEPRRRAA